MGSVILARIFGITVKHVLDVIASVRCAQLVRKELSVDPKSGLTLGFHSAYHEIHVLY